MSVLVTGARGFIGSHLTAELRRCGLRFSAPPVEVGPEADWREALRSETSTFLAYAGLVVAFAVKHYLTRH